MHPPPFRLDQKLSDWIDCHLELHCRACNGRSVVYPMRLVIKRHGNGLFSELLPKLRCSKCKGPPAPAYLCASPNRTGGHGGPAPDWAIQIIPENEMFNISRGK